MAEDDDVIQLMVSGVLTEDSLTPGLNRHESLKLIIYARSPINNRSPPFDLIYRLMIRLRFFVLLRNRSLSFQHVCY